MRCRNATKRNIIVETQQRHNISGEKHQKVSEEKTKQNIFPSLSVVEPFQPAPPSLSTLIALAMCVCLLLSLSLSTTQYYYYKSNSNITINIDSNLLFATNIHIQLIYSKGLLARFYSGIDYTWELKTWSKHRTKWECQDKIQSHEINQNSREVPLKVQFTIVINV